MPNEITLTEIGCQIGQDISQLLNEAIQDYAEGTAFLVPPCPGLNDATSWQVRQPIIPRNGMMLRGVGARSNAVLRRVGTNLLMNGTGSSGGSSSSGMLSNLVFQDIVFDGGQRPHDMMYFRNAAGFVVERCTFRGVEPGGRLMFSPGQFQDSVFRDVYWIGGAAEDGSRAAVEISDELSLGGHTQNLTFDNNTWESYNGSALRIYGRSADLNLAPSLLRIVNSKFESPNRSQSQPDIVVEGGTRLYFDLRQVVTRGAAGKVKPCMIRMTGASYNEVRGNFVHMGHDAASSALTRIVETSGSQYLKIDLTLDNTTANYVTASELISMTTPLGNEFSVNNPGTKNVTDGQQSVTPPPTTFNVRTLTPVVGSIARVDATGSTVSNNRAVAVTNAGGSHYVGFDAENRFALAPTADLNGAVARIDPATGEVFGTALRVGNRNNGPLYLSGAAAPEASVTAPRGSWYSQVPVSAAAAATPWFKASGSGNTGWVQT